MVHDEAPDFVDEDELVQFGLPGKPRPADARSPESSVDHRRVIKLILEGGVRYYTQEVYGQRSLARVVRFVEPTGLVRLQAVAVEHPLTIVQGFPQKGTEFPLLTIIPSSESEIAGAVVLDRYTTTEIDTIGDLGGGRVDVFATSYQGGLRMPIYDQNPEMVLFWYEVVKSILSQCRRVLARFAIDEPLLSGTELMPAKFPDVAESVFTRTVVLSARTESTWAENKGLITSVEAFVDETIHEGEFIGIRAP